MLHHAVQRLKGGKQLLAAAAATDSYRPGPPFQRPRPFESGHQSQPPSTEPTLDGGSFSSLEFEGRKHSPPPTGSSSILPDLPRLEQTQGSHDHTAATPARQRSHSSAYYAAAWGLPYATPSPPRPQVSGKRANTFNHSLPNTSPTALRSTAPTSSFPSFDEPTRNQSAPTSTGSENSLSPSARGLLSAKSERSNWLSDSEESDKEGSVTSAKAQNLQLDDWLGISEDSLDETDFVTPTSKRFNTPGVETRARIQPDHNSQDSSSTVRPEEYWNPDPQTSPSAGTIQWKRDFQDHQQNTQAANMESPEKPLPKLPANTDARSSETTKPVEDTVKSEASRPRPPIPTAVSFQRPKKKVICKGKACIIALPLDDRRGSKTPLLSRLDVKERIENWQSEGFDTRGFILDNDDRQGDQTGGQSRPLYPDPRDMSVEYAQRNFKVTIPNKAEWDAWIRQLKEEKLRALGVTFSDDEPPRQNPSPFSGTMSRSSSYHPGLPLSPPNASSTTSNRGINGVQPFTPASNMSTNTSTQLPSGPSPAFQYNQQPGQPFIAVSGNDKRGESPFGPPAFQAAPGGFPPVSPPPGYFAPRHGGISPMAPGTMKNLGEVLSPVSPLPNDERNISPRPDSMFDNMRQQQEELQAQFRQQQQTSANRPIPHRDTLQRTPAFNEIVGHSNVEIAHPTPRVHNRNVSEALQRDVDAAEDSLERAIRMQLQNRGDEAQKSGKGSQEVTSQADMKAANQSSKHIVPEVQNEGKATPPIVEDSFRDSGISDHSLNAWELPADSSKSSQKPVGMGHRPKPSTSGLNVEAKEFVFNPKATFTPGNFSFSGSDFEPSFAPTKKGSKQTSASSFGTAPAGLNVAAPAFTPAGLTAPEALKAPKSEFKFGSGLKVDAPEFNPSLPAFGLEPQSAKEPSPPTSGPKIFGDFKLDGMPKNRRSKAIPIVRPDDSFDDQDEHSEFEWGEDGKPRLPETYHKRARRFGSEGREFTPAEDSPFLLNEVNNNISNLTGPEKESRPRSSGKENQVEHEIDLSIISDSEELPESVDAKIKDAAGDVSESLNDPQEMPLSVGPEPKVRTPSAEDVANGVEAVETQRSDLENGEVDEPDVPSSPSVPESNHKVTGSSLSATAKPFEPRTSEDDNLQNLDEPIEVDHEIIQEPEKHTILSDESADPTPKASGLAASRFADESIEVPPRKPGHGLAASRFAIPSAELSHPPTEDQKSRLSSENTDSLPVDLVLKASQSVADDILEDRFNTEKTLDAHEAAHRVEGSLSSAESNMDATGVSEHDFPSSETDVLRKYTEAVDSGSIRSSVPQEKTILSPSFEEIDAVMKQLNDPEAELGIERSDPLPQPPSPLLRPPMNMRSDAPSPSPHKIRPLQPRHVLEDSTEMDVQSPQYTLGLGIEAPVQNLNKHLEQDRISDWNDMLESSADEEKFHSRSQYFDGHVDNLVGGILQRRLAPLERSLEVMQRSISLMASGRRSKIATEVELSDADDEDEDIKNTAPYRSRSPALRQRARSSHDSLRKAMLDALETHRETAPKPTANVDLSRMYEVLAEMKMLAEPAALRDRATEMKSVIEDVISTHPRLRGNRVNNDHENGIEKYKLQIDGLETMLKLANERADAEYAARQRADEEILQTRHQLMLAEEEAAQHRESSEEAERSLRDFHMQRKDERDLEHAITELSHKNAALEATLEEYRLSHDKWRNDMHEERLKQKELRGTLYALRKQMEEGSEARQGLRNKFERLQEDMIRASREIANDHAAWMRKEQQLESTNEHLHTALEREKQTSKQLGERIDEVLKDQESSVRAQIALESAREEQSKARSSLERLHAEHMDYQTRSQKTQHDLQSEIASLKNELDNACTNAEQAKMRQETLLEEAIGAKREALTRAAESRESILQEHSQFHERSLNDLRERHARALHNSSEDRQRAEEHYQEKMALANQKIQHLEEKVSHLDERLQVTKAAARAAAEAATSHGAPVPEITSPPRSSMASMPFAKGTEIPEKISPQALRESIMVLQDQLQNREQTIERLEHELAQLDKSGPEKLKAKDTEITWLRELLGVRLDDLDDVIGTLSETDFDRQAARDAAIRLKANLQMEQQVRERAAAASTSNSGSSLSQGISSLASQIQSPRGLPMAAAAAWGNFRKSGVTQPFSSALSDIASIGSQTPSRSTGNPSPQSFLSGLLTPPATAQRIQTPTSAPPKSVGAAVRPLRGYGGPPSQLRSLSAKQTEQRPLRGYSGGSGAIRSTPGEQGAATAAAEPPRTPPQMIRREASYDRDIDSQYGDVDEDASSVIMGRGGEVRIGSPN
ncbi:MAG: hypothetical protein Q9227_008460 [Pyrenula ochraceoflavens]